jgi:hypothetical protein
MLFISNYYFVKNNEPKLLVNLFIHLYNFRITTTLLFWLIYKSLTCIDSGHSPLNLFILYFLSFIMCIFFFYNLFYYCMCYDLKYLFFFYVMKYWFIIPNKKTLDKKKNKKKKKNQFCLQKKKKQTWDLFHYNSSTKKKKTILQFVERKKLHWY